MAVRLLFAVLMLIGPMPFRVCTCAAANQPVTATAESLGHSQVEPTSCKCRSKSQLDGIEAAGIDQHVDALVTPSDAEAPKPVPHDRECPVVDGAPIVAPALPTATPELPDAIHISCSFEDEGVSSEPARTPVTPLLAQHVPLIPLYLAFLTLLI